MAKGGRVNRCKEDSCQLVGESMSVLAFLFPSSSLSIDQDVFLCTGSPTAAGYTDSSNPRSVTVTVTLMKRSARVHRAHARWPLCSHARTASSVTRLSLHVEKHTTVRFAALLFNATHVRHDACSCRRSIDFCFANERLTPFCRSLAAPPDDHLDNQDLNLAQRLVTRGDVCDLCMSQISFLSHSICCKYDCIGIML